MSDLSCVPNSADIVVVPIQLFYCSILTVFILVGALVYLYRLHYLATTKSEVVVPIPVREDGRGSVVTPPPVRTTPPIVPKTLNPVLAQPLPINTRIPVNAHFIQVPKPVHFSYKARLNHVASE
jgi:hypothetical protein